MIPEGLLDTSEGLLRPLPLDRLDLEPIRLNSQRQTGADAAPLEQDGAGPANPMLATDVRAGQ